MLSLNYKEADMTLSRQLFAQFRLEIFSWTQIELTPNNPSEVRLSKISLFWPRLYSKGLSDLKNSLKSYTDHFGQLLKKSIFWVSDVSGPTGSHHFPKAGFSNVQARYRKTVFNIR